MRKTKQGAGTPIAGVQRIADAGAVEADRNLRLNSEADAPVKVTPEEKRFLLKQLEAIKNGEAVDALEFLEELKREG
jgi:hypothetical protein